MSNQHTAGWDASALKFINDTTLSDTAVAERLGKSACAVRAKRQRLGVKLPKKEKSVAAPVVVSHADDKVALDNAHWRKEYQKLEVEYRKSLSENVLIDRLIADIKDIAPRSYKAIPDSSPAPRRTKPQQTPESAVLLFSDTHIGKVVRREQTLGFAEYNFPTFLARLKHLETAALSILEGHTTAPIEELVIPMIGDMLDGALAHGSEAGQRNVLFNQFFAGGHAIAQFFRNLASRVPQIRIVTCVGNHCVDEQTEILTKRGWVRHGDIQPTDECLGLLGDGETAVWQPIDEVVRETAIDRMVSISNRDFDFRGTEHHRFYYWVPGHPMLNEARWSELPKSGTIHVPANGLVSQTAHSDVPDHLIELSAAVLTDGHIAKTGSSVRVYQKLQKEGWVRAAFEKSGIAFARYSREREYPKEIAGRRVTSSGPYTEVSYSLRKSEASEFLSASGVRKNQLPPWVWKMTTPQFERFLRALLMGDGTGVDSDSPCLTLKNQVFGGQIQALAALHGWRGSVSEARPGQFRLNLSRMRHIAIGEGARVAYEKPAGELVWCVRTGTENFFCRRNGKSYFTGNTRWGTQKKMPTENRYSNFDMFLYAFIQSLTKDIPNIHWTLDEQPFAVFKVQGWTFFASHGDNLKGGDKAFGIPMHSMARQMNSTTQLFYKHGQEVPHYYVLGHYHRPIQIPTGLGDFTVNGGFPGLDGYALDGNFNPVDAAQVFFRVHPKYGKVAEYKIQLKHALLGTPTYDLPAQFQCE